MGPPSKSDQSLEPYTRSETEWNGHLRAVMRVQGLTALHVRETDTPGTYDLLVGGQYNPKRPSPQYLWAELKVGDSVLEPSQRGFNRERVKKGDFLLVLRLRAGYSVEVRDGSDAMEHAFVLDYRMTRWDELFRRLLHNYNVDL